MEHQKLTVLQQPNVITQARYSFSEHEMKILLYIIKTIQKEINKGGSTYNRDLFGQIDYKIYFHLADIAENETNLKRIKAAIKDLRKKDFEINDAKRWLNVGFINYGEYNYDVKKWEVQVSHKLMPYMLNVAEGYTEYQLNVVLRLNSHAQRLYMMMSQWNDTGFFVINADELRFKLGLENKYDRFCDFKKWVLKKSETELKDLFKDVQSDLFFSLAEDKKKRGAQDDFDRTLKFKIITTDQKAKSNEDFKTQYVTACTELLRRIYPEKESLVKSIFNLVFKDKRLKEFTDRLLKLEDQSQQEGKALHTYGGLVTHLLRADFGWKD